MVAIQALAADRELVVLTAVPAAQGLPVATRHRQEVDYLVLQAEAQVAEAQVVEVRVAILAQQVAVAQVPVLILAVAAIPVATLGRAMIAPVTFRLNLK